ncbi:MAG: magnesium transporter [Bacilli bacterium]|nr:magnesium transporter [Bacilli bacterium]MBN2877517.1 magnesium transporter [Bacilli bacterium]
MEDWNNYDELTQEIVAILVSEKTKDEIRELIDEYHDYELAKAIKEMNKVDRSLLYDILPSKTLADVFEELTPEDAFLILEETSLTVITRIFRNMEVDDLVDIIECVEDKEDRITYLSLIGVDKRVTVKQYLDFDEDVVGSIMNNSFIEVSPNDTVKQAIKTVVLEAPECEYINNIYVSEDNKLIGVLSLKELISAGNDRTKPVSELMSLNLHTVLPSTPNEDALVIMQNYDFQLLPVVDKYQKLIGIVSFDDMLETLSYESDMDYSSLAAVSEITIDERETVWETIRKRMPWLLILLVLNLFTSSIITEYQQILILLPTLSIFMPLISNMAGNSGTQSLGIIIRLFAKNQLDEKKSVWKHIFNEFLTGVVNGLIIAILLFGVVLLFNTIKGTDFTEGIRFALVVAVSINVALIVSTVSGTLIPLLISLLKLDPAVASGPFITTINDILSLLIYFSLATLMITSLT